jgi:hypothetical protein
MEKMQPLLIIFLTNVLVLGGCMHNAPSENMLEKRAAYEEKEATELRDLKLADNGSIQEMGGGIPARTMPRVAHVWIFPHETPAKEYFWGGWLSVVVEGDKWKIDKPAGLIPDGPGTASPKATHKP